MSKVSVFDYGWIDLVFEGRNQEYGAYQLRRQDSRTTLLALFTGIGIMAALVCIPLALNYFKPAVQEISRELVLPEIADDAIFRVAPEVPKPVVQEPAAAMPKTPEPTIRHTDFEATSAPIVKDPPTTAQVLATNPGTVTDPGTGEGFSTGVTSPTGTPDGTGTTPSNLNGTGTFTTVELDRMPEFPGGMRKFYNYVGTKFKVPETDISNSVTVYVSFIIEKDGTLSNIAVPRDPGQGLGKEAIRVLNSLHTKWKPGIKDGQPVRTAYSLPIKINLK